MPTVLVPLAEGFEELEAVTVIDLLRRAKTEVDVAGLEDGPVRGDMRTVIVSELSLEQALEREYDMVVPPGGLPRATNLGADVRIHDLLRRMANDGRYTTSICAAPSVLANAGVLNHKKATSYPGHLDGFDQISVQTEAVVRDGTVIASRGPGTVMDFALSQIETLVGTEKREAVETPLVRPN